MILVCKIIAMRILVARQFSTKIILTIAHAKVVIMEEIVECMNLVVRLITQPMHSVKLIIMIYTRKIRNFTASVH